MVDGTGVKPKNEPPSLEPKDEPPSLEPARKLGILSKLRLPSEKAVKDLAAQQAAAMETKKEGRLQGLEEYIIEGAKVQVAADKAAATAIVEEKGAPELSGGKTRKHRKTRKSRKSRKSRKRTLRNLRKPRKPKKIRKTRKNK